MFWWLFVELVVWLLNGHDCWSGGGTGDLWAHVQRVFVNEMPAPVGSFSHSVGALFVNEFSALWSWFSFRGVKFQIVPLDVLLQDFCSVALIVIGLRPLGGYLPYDGTCCFLFFLQCFSSVEFTPYFKVWISRNACKCCPQWLESHESICCSPHWLFILPLF